MERVNWLELTPEEFIKRRAEYPVCYMPYGLTECHGHYNNMGVDWFPVSKVCTMAAQKGGGIVAPYFAWHIDEEPEFNWSIRGCGMGEFICCALPPYMFFHNMLYHLRAFDARGFKAVLLVSGHAVPGTKEDISLMIDYYKLRTGSPIMAEYFCYFDLFKKDDFPGYSRDHGGDLETACAYGANTDDTPMLNLGREPEFPEIGGGNEKRNAYNAPKDFVSDASRGKELKEIGIKAIELLSEYMKDRMKALYDTYVEPENRPKAPDYYELEGIWTSFEQITRRYWKTNINYEQYVTSAKHPDFPGWDWFVEK
ncbi:MAG: creatininase family protein [Clostridiales bacterium]|nr:creatininase family protein [Clostridiales bacterium]